MTEIYFVRHAQADSSVLSQRDRPLTPKGVRDSLMLSSLFSEIHIDSVLSSPYKRAVDTVWSLADSKGLDTQIVEDFRGLKLNSMWIKDYRSFFKDYWSDFTYSYKDGESLSELKNRTVSYLEHVLDEYQDKSIVICTHSVLIAIVLNYFNNNFGLEGFLSIANIEPYIVKMEFNGYKISAIKEISL